MTPKICVSTLPKTVPEALRLIEKAEAANADFIEVRLDRLEDCLENHRGLADLAAHVKTPKIATDKASRNETEHRQMLTGAAKSGFEYVDVELSTPQLEDLIKELKALGAKPIVSFHKFDGSLSISELNSILERQISSGAEVCKIVTTAKQVQDNLTTLNFTSTASTKAKVVCFCMGELGKVSRLLSPLFGGFFTFASLERGSETAFGQMAIQEMKAAYEILG
ncbi:type I 3-dehydroquinate dehydratase [Candidatus Bathyarchaeota archaeon]|nr:type I 3-dehydroquinate dehydratase [Candidatus Bathyarchaeota archaeon]